MTTTRRLLLQIAAIAVVGAFGLSVDAAERTLRLAHVNQADSPSGLGSQRFADLVAEYTDGRIEVQVFPQGQLGNNREIFTQLTTASIEMAISPFGFISDIVPEYSSLLAGYFYEDWDQLKSVLESETYGQAWNQRLVEDGGIRLLASFYYGARQVTMSSEPPTSPEGFQGVKLRAVPNPMSLAVVSGLGASPTPVPFPELFQALRQGVVDGQENPIPTIHAQKFYEVQDYLMLTSHQRLPLPWIINDEVYQSLSEEDRDALHRAAAEAAEWTTAKTLEEEESLLADLAERGMTVVELSEDQRAAFRDSVQASVRETFDGKEWPAGFMDELLASIGG